MNLNQYWDKRISEHKLSGTGDISLHPKVNELIKNLKMKTISFIIEFKGKKVLDAGCGVGIYSKLAQEMGASQVIAIDFAPSAIKITKSIHIEGITASISYLPFKNSCFDVVMCLSVLYHIVDDSLWETAINELIRVLKPDGQLLLQIEYCNNQSNLYHYRGRPFELYLKKFRESELNILKVEDVYAPPDNNLSKLLLRFVPILGKILIKKRKQNLLIVLKK